MENLNSKDITAISIDTVQSEQEQVQSSPAELLLAWYDQNPRTMPWREHPDPYWIWVSEIMLQQTRLNVVIPYFYKFVESLPNIMALADAEEGLLLKLWEGLGYYSRVRNLQKAARIMVERHEGKLPDSYKHLLALPGIGEYTAGAIASIAFHIPVPAVDGNVLRVMARLQCCREDIAKPGVKKLLRAAVEEILPEKRPGDFNQAMMDLGETVCLPNTSPCCNLCPLRAICAGYYEGMSSKLPFKSPRKPRAIQQKTVLIFISEGKVLLHRRPASGLLAGLWEFPNFDGWLDENNVAALLDEWGISSLAISKTAGSRHIFTHMEWHIQGYLVYSANALPVGDNLWAEGAAVRKEYAIPSAFKFFTRNLAQWLKYI